MLSVGIALCCVLSSGIVGLATGACCVVMADGQRCLDTVCTVKMSVVAARRCWPAYAGGLVGVQGCESSVWLLQRHEEAVQGVRELGWGEIGLGRAAWVVQGWCFALSVGCEIVLCCVFVLVPPHPELLPGSFTLCGVVTGHAGWDVQQQCLGRSLRHRAGVAM